jgi:hypothetical protein
MWIMALRNVSNVGSDGTSSHYTVDHLVAATKLFQELKNSSDMLP